MVDHPRETKIRPAIDQFWESVPPVWNQVRCQLRATAAEQFNISVEQFHVLRLIRHGLTSVSAIAENRRTSRPAVSQTADILVRRGLITRRQETGDRRYVHLALTLEGDSLLNQIFQQNRAWMQERLAALSVDELERIADGLALLKSAFAAETKPQSDPTPAAGVD